MATEAHVLFDAALPTIKDINAELSGLGFPVRLQDGHDPLTNHGGFLPATLRRQQSGCEFDVRSGPDAADDLDPPDAAKPFSCCVSLRWASDEDEAGVGLCLAAALAKLTKGIVLEEFSGEWQNAGKAVDHARQHLKAAGGKRGPAEPGARPADIKRYLKSLLAEGDDLVLVGRHLLIRPVRHVLRGALFDRTGERTRFCLWRYLNPLYEHPGSVGYDQSIHCPLWDVTAAHFMPLLMDSLQHDIFAELGTLTTLEGLARRLEGDRDKISPYVVALLLAGRAQTASEVMDQLEGRDPIWKRWLAKERQLLERDIKAICAEFHEREERTVQELRIASIWEPSPFPAELPEHERESVAEPQFQAGRWPAGAVARAARRAQIQQGLYLSPFPSTPAGADDDRGRAAGLPGPRKADRGAAPTGWEASAQHRGPSACASELDRPGAAGRRSDRVSLAFPSLWQRASRRDFASSSIAVRGAALDQFDRCPDDGSPAAHLVLQLQPRAGLRDRV